MNKDALKLFGSWITDPDDSSSNETVQLDFSDNGRCAYTIKGEESDQVMLLTYRVEDNVIFTDQPSRPREEKTQFYFTADGKLVLIYDNEMTQYVRVID